MGAVFGTLSVRDYTGKSLHRAGRGLALGRLRRCRSMLQGKAARKCQQYNAKGVTFQLTVNTGTGFFNGSTTLSSGNLNILCKPGY